MTEIVPRTIECPGYGRRFEAYVVVSVFLTGNEARDREERAMIEDLTRNECPNCGHRASELEVVAASEKPLSR